MASVLCSIRRNSTTAVRAVASGRAEKTFWFRCRSNALPLSRQSSSNVLGRSFFKPFLERIARSRSLLRCHYGHSGSYREIRAVRGWARRWPHRCDEAGRTAATLDELLIWTNQDTIGREYAQKNEDSERFSSVSTGRLLCSILTPITWYSVPLTDQIQPCGSHR